jgi:tripartite-type tricarboxylate transporter receptor subunit TctC
VSVRPRASLLIGVLIAVSACTGSGSTAAPSTASSAAPTTAATSGASPSDAAPSAAAGAFTYKDGVLQPLADGFPNKPIVMLNGDDPGSDDGIYIRELQAILKSVSPVALEVSDKPGPQFGMWTMTAEMNDTEDGKAGYQPAVAAFTGGALDLITSPVKRDLGLELKDINPVIATEKVPFVIATRADAPWQTWQEFVDYGKANPSKVKYLARVGSQLDIAASRLFAESGITVTKIAGGSTTEIGTALGAGAGDVAALLPGTALPHFQAGKERILLVIGDQAPAPWTDAATTTSIGLKDEPWGTVRGFIVPAAVPEEHRLWLAELFRKATESDAYKQRNQAVPGLAVVNYDKQQVLDTMQNALTFGEPVIRELKLAWDQQ